MTMTKTLEVDPNAAAEAVAQGQAAPAAPAGQDANAQAQADLSQSVREAARRYLRGGFGNGKDYKADVFQRRMINTIFQNELGTMDLGETDQTVDAVFATVAQELSDNAEDIGTEIGRQITERLKAIGLTATRAVTLTGGVVALDAAKAYVNWRPSAKLVNATFFKACE